MKRVFPLLAASVLSLGVMSCSDDGDDKKDPGSAVDPLKAKLAGTWKTVKSVDAEGNETVYSLTPGDNQELVENLWEFDGNNLKIHELVDNYIYARTADGKFDWIPESTEAETRTVDYTITANTITGDFDGDSTTADETITYEFSDNTLITKPSGIYSYHSTKYDGDIYPSEWDTYTNAASILDGMGKTNLLAGSWKTLVESNVTEDSKTTATINTTNESMLDVTLNREVKAAEGDYRTAAAVVSLGDIDLKKISTIIVSYEVANTGDVAQLHFSNIDDGSSTSLDGWAGDQAYGTFQVALENGKAGETVTDTISVADMSLLWWGADSNPEDTKAVEVALDLTFSTEEWGKWARYYNFDDAEKSVNNLHLLDKEKFVFITNYNDDWKEGAESFNVKISKLEVLSLN